MSSCFHSNHIADSDIHYLEAGDGSIRAFFFEEQMQGVVRCHLFVFFDEVSTVVGLCGNDELL